VRTGNTGGRQCRPTDRRGILLHESVSPSGRPGGGRGGRAATPLRERADGTGYGQRVADTIGRRCGATTTRKQLNNIGETMGMLKEFREFAVKGNVIDLAVGVIIGAAFGKIVDSLVKDVIMPIVNFIAGGNIDFSNKYWILRGDVPAGAALAEAQKSAVVFAWGSFLTVMINFIILAFIIFWMVKAVNRVKAAAEKPAAAAPAAPPEDIVLLREIRDSLKK
jgi:large conductance mechanosensitive channel